MLQPLPTDLFWSGHLHPLRQEASECQPADLVGLHGRPHFLAPWHGRAGGEQRLETNTAPSKQNIAKQKKARSQSTKIPGFGEWLVITVVAQDSVRVLVHYVHYVVHVRSPCHSQEWRSPAMNIISDSMKILAFHHLLRWMKIILQYRFSLLYLTYNCTVFFCIVLCIAQLWVNCSLQLRFGLT